MLACMQQGQSFGCCQNVRSSFPLSLQLKPALFLQRTSSSTLISAVGSPTTLAVEPEAASLQLDTLLAGRWPAPAASPDVGSALPYNGGGHAEVTAWRSQTQAIAVQQVSAEISRLLTEIDQEIDSFFAATSAFTLPPARRSEPQPQSASRADSLSRRLGVQPVPSPLPGDAQPLGSGRDVAGLPNPAAAGAFDPLALISTQPQARPAGLLPQLSLTLPAAQAQADSKTAVGQSPGSDAGSRAERRRQKLRRNSTSAGAELVMTHEAKYKANGNGSMSILMGSFSKDHILNAEEEKLLASTAQDFMQLADLRRLLAAVLKRPPSMAEMAKSLHCDETALRVRMDCGSRARTLLAQKNYRLVVNIAKRMVRSAGAGAGGGTPAGTAVTPVAAAGDTAAGGANPAGDNGVSLDDAITVGMEALMYAIRKFKPEAGYRLSTYATWWIRLYVSRLVHAQAGVVTLSTYQRGKLDRVRSVRARLRAVLPPGTNPSRQQIADACGLSVAQVEEMEAAERVMMAGTRSFEAPLSDGDRSSTMEDLVAQDDDSEVSEGLGSSLLLDSEDFAASASLSAAVEDLLSSLDSQESELLRRKYGLEPAMASAEAEEEGGEEAAEAQLQLQLKQLRGKGTGGWELGGEAEAASSEAEAASSEAGKESGASRLKLGRKRRLSANKALEKLRLSLDDDSPLADWLDLKNGRANLAQRTPGYAKKDR